MNKEQAVNFLMTKPVQFARMLGFDKLKDFQNDWIIDMVRGKEDETLQSSRGTYKTTCVSFALSLSIILLPNYRTMFMRKTDTDVKEVVKQVQNILLDAHTQYFVQVIYGVNLRMDVQSATEIKTNLTTDIKGTSQLVGTGIGSSLTGKHFDRIFTDDIVNVNDRISQAERERTKIVYQELQNVKNRGGKIFNTGTPWHKDDCFSIMPEAKKFNCYHEDIKQIITEKELANIKESMIPSLFAANYELRHIASDDIIFTDPVMGANIELVRDGIMHVDSAFYGEDYTALTIAKIHDGKIYMYGRMWRKHVEECYPQISELYNNLMCGRLYMERNADKGMVARDLKNMGMRTVPYDESMNKFIKIATWLKSAWKHVVFVEGTDAEYIEQICDYNENAEHDDAPDSAACIARLLYPKLNKREYTPIIYGRKEQR